MEMSKQKDDLISFWFDRDNNDWYFPPDGFDDEIRTKYQHLITKARSGELDHWAQDPKGALCLVLLLDQFPRNIFRGSGESFSSDGKALEIVTKAIVQGLDAQLGQLSRFYQLVFYLPLMHAEDVMAQIASVSLCHNVQHACGTGTAEKEEAGKSIEAGKRHLDCVARLGRFPARNELLGRSTTEEEKEFLKEHPAGF